MTQPASKRFVMEDSPALAAKIDTATANSTYERVVTGLVDNDATDNAAKIQAALDLGGHIIIPPTTGRYAVGATLNITVPGTKVTAWGAPIRLTIAPYELFAVKAADVTIDGLKAYGSLTTLDTTGMTAAWQMTITASRWTAISAYNTADRLTIPWIYGSGFSSVVRVVNWDAVSNTASGVLSDVTLGTVLCDNVEFGVVGQGVDKFNIDTIKGTYLKPTGGTRAAHLLYFSGVGSENTNMTIGDCVAVSGAGGEAFQLKGVSSGRVRSLRANACPGVAYLQDNLDLTVDSIASIGDTYTGSDGALTLGQTTAQARVLIKQASIRMASDQTAVKVFGGTDTTLRDLYVEPNHTTSGVAVYDVSVAGGANTLIDGLTVNNVSATNSWRAVGLISGTGTVIKRYKATNVRVGYWVSAPVSLPDYDPNTITLHPVDGYVKTVVGAVATFTKPPEIPRAVVYDRFRLSPGSGTSFGQAPSGQAWIVQSGTWVSDTVNGVASETSSAAHRTAVIDTGLANVDAEVGIKWARAEGLVIRSIDTNNWIGVYPDLASLELVKFDAGVITSLGSFAMVPQAGRHYVLRLSAFVDKVDAYLDGVKVISITLSAGDQTKYGASTKAGLHTSSGSGAGRFDNFVVRPA